LPRFDLAHWYWKADRDPEIYDGVFARDWRRVDYLILTPQVYADGADLPFLASTINHADILASFGNGDWPVTIARTRIPKSMNVASDTLLQRQWADWRPPIASSSGGLAKARPDLRSFALLAAVYMDDRTEFDAIWSWTRTNVQAADGRIAAKPATRPGAAPSGLAGPRVDTDTAVALAFAAARWKSDGYRTAATQLIDAIWTHETLAVKDGRLVVPAHGQERARAQSSRTYRRFRRMRIGSSPPSIERTTGRASSMLRIDSSCPFKLRRTPEAR
jgi:hypothetical protein